MHRRLRRIRGKKGETENSAAGKKEGGRLSFLFSFNSPITLHDTTRKSTMERIIRRNDILELESSNRLLRRQGLGDAISSAIAGSSSSAAEETTTPAESSTTTTTTTTQAAYVSLFSVNRQPLSGHLSPCFSFSPLLLTEQRLALLRLLLRPRQQLLLRLLLVQRLQKLQKLQVIELQLPLNLVSLF